MRRLVTTGDEFARPGNLDDQRMPRPRDHLTGRFFSDDTPSPLSPRNCGHDSACDVPTANRTKHIAKFVSSRTFIGSSKSGEPFSISGEPFSMAHLHMHRVYTIKQKVEKHRPKHLSRMMCRKPWSAEISVFVQIAKNALFQKGTEYVHPINPIFRHSIKRRLANCVNRSIEFGNAREDVLTSPVGRLSSMAIRG